jgi:cytoskeleton protein RodZ
MEAVADTAGTPSARTLGQTLAAERERQGLSRADVAQRLHMSAYQIEAIENGDYARLPQGTFLRGFVRNYAKVLGLQAESLLAMLVEATAPKRPGIVVPTESIRFDPLGQRLDNPYVKAVVIAFVLIALGFAAMYWWLFIRPTPPAAMAHKPAMEMRSQTPAAFAAPAPRLEPIAPPVASTPPAAAALDARKTPAPIADAAKKTEPPKPAPPPVNAAQGSTLKFVFKGQSWVEVRDKQGRLLFSRLNPAGSEPVEVSGRPPFNVVVGNAPDVQLYYNDHEFDLEPHTKVAVARFTVE